MQYNLRDLIKSVRGKDFSQWMPAQVILKQQYNGWSGSQEINGRGSNKEAQKFCTDLQYSNVIWVRSRKKTADCHLSIKHGFL